jgi:hypothetical protein
VPAPGKLLHHELAGYSQAPTLGPIPRILAIPSSAVTRGAGGPLMSPTCAQRGETPGSDKKGVDINVKLGYQLAGNIAQLSSTGGVQSDSPLEWRCRRPGTGHAVMGSAEVLSEWLHERVQSCQPRVMSVASRVTRLPANRLRSAFSDEALPPIERPEAVDPCSCPTLKGEARLR